MKKCQGGYSSGLRFLLVFADIEPVLTQTILTLLTVRARVDLIVVAAQENFFFHNSPKVVVGHGLKDYGVKNLFTM